MYFYAEDPALGVTVVVHRGVSSDAEQAGYVDTLVTLNKRSQGHDKMVLVLVSDRDAEPPNPKWRQRIADVSRDTHPSGLFAFVSESGLARGVVTAINWIRPPRFSFTVTSDVLKAIEWVEERRPGIRPIVQRLYVEARTASERRMRVLEKGR